MKNICVWVALLCIGTTASAQDGGTPEPAQPVQPAAAPASAPAGQKGDGGQVPLVNPPQTKKDAPPEKVLSAVKDCVEKKDKPCNSLADLATTNPDGYLAIQLWCGKNAANFLYSSYSGSVAKVCRAALKKPNDRANVTRFDLALFGEQVNEPAFECGGFGLTLPLFSVRRSGGDYEVNGPVAAGIGGGYYYAMRCRETWTWGPEVFAFSEGLDPSKTFQVGVAAGLSVTAFKYFNFGLAVGYDVFRRQTLDDGSKRSTGLLTGKDLNKENLTWLITFGVQNVSEKKTDDEGSKTATTPAG
jgi:hypothetical protein